MKRCRKKEGNAR